MCCQPITERRQVQGTAKSAHLDVNAMTTHCVADGMSNRTSVALWAQKRGPKRSTTPDRAYMLLRSRLIDSSCQFVLDLLVFWLESLVRSNYIWYVPVCQERFASIFIGTKIRSKLSYTVLKFLILLVLTSEIQT